MDHSTEVFKLPAGPAELCFDKNEFMKVFITLFNQISHFLNTNFISNF